MNNIIVTEIEQVLVSNIRARVDQKEETQEEKE